MNGGEEPRVEDALSEIAPLLVLVETFVRQSPRNPVLGYDVAPQGGSL
jgi:hypothetical protein